MNTFIIFHYGNVYSGKAKINKRGMFIADTIELNQSIKHLSQIQTLDVCYHFDKSNLFDVEILPNHLNKEDLK